MYSHPCLSLNKFCEQQENVGIENISHEVIETLITNI